MKINLLQKWHDIVTENFIDGKIELYAYLKCEEYFTQNSKLYTICLN